MSEDRYAITAKRAVELVHAYGLEHDVEFTEQEIDAVTLGIGFGVQAAVEVIMAQCPVCQGVYWHPGLDKWIPTRETVGLVCQKCGRDYDEGSV